MTDIVSEGPFTDDNIAPGVQTLGRIDTETDADWYRFVGKLDVDYTLYVAQWTLDGDALPSATIVIYGLGETGAEPLATGAVNQGISFSPESAGEFYVAVEGDGAVGDFRVLLLSTEKTYKGTAGDDAMYGSDADDVMKAGAGDDEIYSNPGDDKILGGAGDDTMLGGLGDDLLIGGGGDDTIHFRPGDGHDRIKGFGGGDQVNLAAFDFSKKQFKKLLNKIDDHGKHAELELGDDSLTFLKRDADDLHLSDFIL
ncbi:hypothetical protein P2H44_05235 [Albimonas sp. CAU 1670]|uniref:calcium-binding protein n=1 Tax=Albimonas sp. CAU 1670 TaxID=3032599 RepID=UPI0023DB9966|nr:hypothetical protein [Albimonas sp. CAU 1670]MDF2231950.1 hypothetical protein [Albimonas sp. CAU 1670]